METRAEVAQLVVVELDHLDIAEDSTVLIKKVCRLELLRRMCNIGQTGQFCAEATK